MKFIKPLPSDHKGKVNTETGVKYSDRDISVISSLVNFSSSLIKFSEEIYNKHKDSGNSLLVYEGGEKGVGYLAYTVGDLVNVNDIYVKCINKKEDFIAYEALVETVFNLCKSLSKDLEIETDKKSFKEYVSLCKQKYKEQKIEDRYWWKTK